MPRIHQDLLSFFAALCLVFSGSELLSQPFPCDNGQRLYFFRNGGTNGTLACFENYTTTPTIVNLCPLPTANHNGLAGNPVDGYLYYLDNTVLTRLSSNCTATPVCSLAFTSFYGGFDLFGRYWTVDGNSLVAIDLNSCSIVKGPFPINTTSGMVDLAFNPYDCFIYVGNQRYDTTGTVDPTFTAPSFGGTAQYAGATFGNDGNLYAIGTNLFSTASVLSTLNPVAGTVGFITSFSPGVTLNGGIDMGSFPCYTLEPEFGFDVSGCQPITVSFQDSTQGPVGTWNYQWDFGDPNSGAANTSTLANPTHAYSQPGSYPVRLIVSIAPAGLCLASFYQDTIIRTITVFPDTLNATLSTQGAGCAGLSTGSASLSLQTGTAPFTYQWTPAVSSGPAAGNLSAGNYTVVVSDAGGCTKSFSFTIPQPNALVIAPIQVTGVQCAGNGNGSASYSANGGIPPYTYQWSAGTPNGNSVSGLSGGTYQLTVTDASGCISTATFNITEPPPFTASLASPGPVCPGNAVVLAPQVQGGTGPYQYLWSNGSTGASLSTIPSGTQTYTLSITDASGCTASGSPLTANTTAFAPIVFPVQSPAFTLCTGDSVELTAPIGMSSYSWNPGTGILQNTGSSIWVSPSASTQYALQVTDANGCTAGNTYAVNVSAAVVNAGPSQALCAGASVNLNASTGLSSYVWSPTTGLSSTNIPNPIAAPATTTTYSIVGTNANGCKDSAQVTIIVNQLNLSSTPSASVCNGFSAALSATPGLSSYTWSPSAGLSATNIANPVANPSSTTTYMLIASDANGCVDTSFTTVTVNGLTVSTSPTQQICVGDSASLSATPGLVSYVWSPATGLSNAAVSNPLAQPASTTAYTVIATDVNGCTGSASTTITVNSLSLSTLSPIAICLGDNATLVADPGLSTYTWTASGSVVGVNSATLTVSPTTTTSVQLLAIDNNSCSDSTSTTVTVNNLSLTSPGNPYICIGSSATLASTPGLVSYLWNPAGGLSSSTSSNPQASPTVTTTYTLTATDANGCSDTVSSTVSVGDPVIAANAPTSICIGDTTMLSASAGFINYSWSPSIGLASSTSATPAASPQQTTTYTVIGTAAGGCTASATTTVTVNSLSLSPLAPTAICLGNDATLVADPGLSIYTWTAAGSVVGGNSATLTVSPTTTTTVQLLAIDNNGCSDSTSTTVTVNSLSLSSPGNPYICIGSSATLASTPGLVSYLWSPAGGLSSSTSSNPQANPSVTTTYTLTATDANGCSDTVSSTVTVGDPIIAANAPTSICIGDTTILSASAGFINYSWSPSIGLASSTSATPAASPQQTTTYTVIGTAAGGCTASATTIIAVNSLSLSALPAASICVGDSLLLNTPAGLSSYSWTPAGSLNSGSVSSPWASPITTTVYTLVALDANGCRDTVSTSVTVNSLSLNPIAPVAVCLGDSVTLIATPALSAYTWSPAAGLSSAVSASPLASPTVSTVYTLRASDSNGCLDSTQVLVTVNKFDLTSSNDTSICIGGAATLQSTPSLATYSWSPSTGLSSTTVANPTAIPTASTTYTLRAVDANGCRDSVRILVTVNALNLIAGPDTGICPGEMVQLYANPGLNSYTWTPGSGLNSTSLATPICTPNQSTVYTLTATDNNGCSSSAGVTVTVYDVPVAAFSYLPQAPTILLPDVRFSDLSSGATSWWWSFGDGAFATDPSPVHAFDSAGTYPVWLVVSNDGGCTDSTLQIIEVKSDYAIWLPNAFTPNDDGQNEFFRSESFNVNFIELLVFNRFGEMLFRSTSPSEGWDGSYQGNPCPEGTYVCLLRYTDPDKEFHEASRHFSLLR